MCPSAEMYFTIGESIDLGRYCVEGFDPILSANHPELPGCPSGWKKASWLRFI